MINPAVNANMASPVYTIAASGPDRVPEGWTPDRWSYRVTIGVLEGQATKPEFAQLLPWIVEAVRAYLLEGPDYDALGVDPADVTAVDTARMVIEYQRDTAVERRDG